jgi:hypothetical protein
MWYNSVLFHRYTLPQVLHENTPGPSDGGNWCMPLPLERGSEDVLFINDVAVMPWCDCPNICSRWVVILDVSVKFLGKSSRIFICELTSAFNIASDKIGCLHCWLLGFRSESDMFLEVASDTCLSAELWCVVVVLPHVTLSAVKLPSPSKEKSPVEWILPQGSATLRVTC